MDVDKAAHISFYIYMTLKFEIQADILKKIPLFLNDVQKQALPKANRAALNRSLITLRNEMARRTKKHYKLKTGELKRDYLTPIKAHGNNVYQQTATLKVSGRPISLIRFLTKAKRSPVSQKGKSIKQRRPLKIEIKPGSSRSTKLFVQKGKGGKTHVFRRQTGKKKGGKEVMAKQSAPGLTSLYDQVKSIRLQSSRVAYIQYKKEFDRQFRFFVNKAEGRLK